VIRGEKHGCHQDTHCKGKDLFHLFMF
jgi:hypothetical protein